MKKWYFKNEKNNLIEATENNVSLFFNSLTKTQIPMTDKEHEEIENKYKQQLNTHVKSYFDGQQNVIEFI